MAGSLNKVMLIGNLGRDPEVKRFDNGGMVVNFSIATSEAWRDKSTGEKQERTQWHNIAVFNEGIAKVAEKYLRKGSKVFVEGQLETRKWQDQSGNDRYSTEVVLRPFNGNLTMLDGKSGGGNGGSAGSNDKGGDLGYSQGEGKPQDDLDDEIPF